MSALPGVVPSGLFDGRVVARFTFSFGFDHDLEGLVADMLLNLARF